MTSRRSGISGLLRGTSVPGLMSV